MQVLLYRLTSPSGKQYIGQTVGTLAARFRKHCRGYSGCLALRAAIQKYGAGSFKLEELGRVPEALADYAEARLIKTCRTMSPAGYNLMADSSVYREFAPEVRDRMSRTAKARWADPEIRPVLLAQTAFWTAAVHTPEAEARAAEGHRTPERRAAAGERLASRWADPEARARMVSALAAVRASAEYRAAQSAVRKRLLEDPEFRSRESERINRPETRAKLAAISRSPEGRASRSAIAKAAWARPEHRARVSALLSAAFKKKGALHDRAVAVLHAPETEALRVAAVRRLWADPAYRARRTKAMRAAWVLRKSRKAAPTDVH